MSENYKDGDNEEADIDADEIDGEDVSFDKIVAEIEASNLASMISVDLAFYSGFVTFKFYGPNLSDRDSSSGEFVGKLILDVYDENMPKQAIALARYINLRGYEVSQSEIEDMWDEWYERDAYSRDSLSWIIKNRNTGEVLMEISQRSKLESVNLDTYEVVPILEHLARLNQENDFNIDSEEAAFAANFVRGYVNHANSLLLFNKMIKRAAFDDHYASVLGEWLLSEDGNTVLLRDVLCRPFQNMFDGNKIEGFQNLDWDNAWADLDSAKLALMLNQTHSI